MRKLRMAHKKDLIQGTNAIEWSGEPMEFIRIIRRVQYIIGDRRPLLILDEEREAAMEAVKKWWDIRVDQYDRKLSALAGGFSVLCGSSLHDDPDEDCYGCDECDSDKE